MKMIADLISSTGVAPLTEQMAELRKENMTLTQFVEIAGQTAADLGVRPEEIVEGFLAMKKDHLDGVFSYPAEEGVLPQDRAGAADYLDGLLEKVVKAPFLAQVFDPVAIAREGIRQRGIHNIDDFLNKGIIAQTGIFSPEMINEYLQRRSIEPIPIGGNGAPVGRPDEGVVSGREGLSVAGAINGAGRPRDY
jgi:hypothetical protein